MIQPSPAIAHLRAATQQIHHSLEDELDVVERLSRLPERRQLIQHYDAFYTAAAATTAPWLAGLDGLDGLGQDRIARLQTDLADLDVPATPATPPRLSSPAEALGFCYVVEGSALGGRVIVKALTARGVDLNGLGFLDCRGARTGEVWRAFVGNLDRHLGPDPASLDAAAAGALAGFAFARSCLVRRDVLE
jgi:heme oxygenase